MKPMIRLFVVLSLFFTLATAPLRAVDATLPRTASLPRLLVEINEDLSPPGSVENTGGLPSPTRETRIIIRRTEIGGKVSEEVAGRAFGWTYSKNPWCYAVVEYRYAGGLQVTEAPLGRNDADAWSAPSEIKPLPHEKLAAVLSALQKAVTAVKGKRAILKTNPDEALLAIRSAQALAKPLFAFPVAQPLEAKPVDDVRLKTTKDKSSITTEHVKPLAQHLDFRAREFLELTDNDLTELLKSPNPKAWAAYVARFTDFADSLQRATTPTALWAILTSAQGGTIRLMSNGKVLHEVIMPTPESWERPAPPPGFTAPKKQPLR